MKHGNKVHIPKKEVVNSIFQQKNEHKTVAWASRIIHHVATTTQYRNPMVIEASKNTSQILQLSHFPNRCLPEHFFTETWFKHWNTDKDEKKRYVCLEARVKRVIAVIICCGRWRINQDFHHLVLFMFVPPTSLFIKLLLSLIKLFLIFIFFSLFTFMFIPQFLSVSSKDGIVIRHGATAYCNRKWGAAISHFPCIMHSFSTSFVHFWSGMVKQSGWL